MSLVINVHSMIKRAGPPYLFVLRLLCQREPLTCTFNLPGAVKFESSKVSKGPFDTFDTLHLNPRGYSPSKTIHQILSQYVFAVLVRTCLQKEWYFTVE